MAPWPDILATLAFRSVGFWLRIVAAFAKHYFFRITTYLAGRTPDPKEHAASGFLLLSHVVARCQGSRDSKEVSQNPKSWQSCMTSLGRESQRFVRVKGSGYVGFIRPGTVYASLRCEVSKC